VEPPVVQITSAAIVALKRDLAATGLAEPVASILWSIGGTHTWIDEKGEEQIASDGSAWIVGFYDAAKLAPEDRCDLQEMPFCFLQSEKIQRRLNGALLHWANGQYEVTEGEI
jgi:hypothetical protein